MTRPQITRWLRIAWSVWWGILCVLLIVLWMRSYVYSDLLMVRLTNTSRLYFRSMQEELYLPLETRNEPELFDLPWAVRSRSIKHLQERMDWVDPASGPVTTVPPRFGITNDSSEFALPHWLVVALTGTLAALSWFPLGRKAASTWPQSEALASCRVADGR
jgi:hypothetical protein